jgi:hypothetical protein
MWLDVLSTEEFENVVRQQNRSEVIYRIMHESLTSSQTSPTDGNCTALWFFKLDSHFHTPIQELTQNSTIAAQFGAIVTDT